MHRFCLLDGGQDQGSSLHVMEMGATVASQDALVEWALQEEEDNIDDKKRQTREHLHLEISMDLSVGQRPGPLLWHDASWKNWQPILAL